MSNQNISKQQIPKKKKIQNVLAVLFQKRLSYVFRKIVLFDDEDLSDNQQTIKHYDLECQAVQSIEGILRGKIMNEKLKAFHQIKNHHRLRSKNSIPTRQRLSSPVFLSKENNFLNLSSTQSFARIRNSYQSDKPMINISRPSIVFDRNPEQFSSRKQLHEQSHYEQSIGQIMGKLHEINRVGSPRANISFMSRYMSATDLYGESQQGKRMFIMEKLSNLERDINDLASRGEGFHQKSRNLDYSYQSITPNAKSVRNFQRIPGGYTRISEDIY